MIEAAAARAGRRDQQTIEGRTTTLVLVEAVAHELSQEARALRVAEPDHTTHDDRVLAQRCDRPAELHVRRKVAHGHEAEASHLRSGGLVDHFVEARIEAGRPAHRASIGRELPGGAWNQLRWP